MTKLEREIFERLERLYHEGRYEELRRLFFILRTWIINKDEI
jgi:hypothetical protein